MTNGKIISFLLISILLLASFPKISAISVDSNEEVVLTTTSTKEWTLMFYDDADFSGYDPLDWFAEKAFSSENINVIVLQDKEHDPANMWYIDNNHNKILLEELGEVNMGDYFTLFNFINYSKSNYPAERYMLFFYNHGRGWQGACVDNTSQDALTMDEIQQALTNNSGVDITCFSAPCLMGAVESAYELRNCTDVYIGSEETSGYVYWGDTMSEIYLLLDTSPDITNVEIGDKIIELIKNNLKSPEWRKWRKSVTMSSIETSKLDSVANSIDKLAKDLSQKIEKNSYRIKLIQALSQPFGKYKILMKSNIIDVYDFSKKCYIFFFMDKTIRVDAKNVMTSIDNAVIANLKGLKHPRAHGLTIYFPSNSIYYDDTYVSSGLDFTTNTYWDEFLTNYLT